MKAVGALCVVVGLVLIGLCVSGWDTSQSRNLGRAVTDYRQEDKADLAGLMRSGDINSSGSLVAKGLGGVIWLGLGIVLLKKAADAQPQARQGGRSYPRR